MSLSLILSLLLLLSGCRDQRISSVDASRVLPLLHYANNVEMEFGDLAMRRGETPEVRRYGATAKARHQQLDSRTARAAAGLNLSLAAAPLEPQSARSQKLIVSRRAWFYEIRHCTPAAFDEKFLEVMSGLPQSDLIAAIAEVPKRGLPGDIRELISETVKSISAMQREARGNLFTEIHPPQQGFVGTKQMVKPDAEQGVKVLVPGTAITWSDLLRYQSLRGGLSAERHWRRMAAGLNLKPDDVVTTINADGFKGPEIDHAHSRCRILCLGDSIMFGPLIDQWSLPRQLECEFRNGRMEVEVINGAVNGYRFRDAAIRLKDYQALHPEIAIVLLGWCDVQADGYPDSVSVAQQYAPHFRPEADALIRGLQSTGSRVVILTLPYLYWSSAESGRVAEPHAPAIARMIERTNTALRGMAKGKHCELIDLSKWSQSALTSDDYEDSNHPNARGYAKAASFVAANLAPWVKR